MYHFILSLVIYVDIVWDDGIQYEIIGNGIEQIQAEAARTLLLVDFFM